MVHMPGVACLSAAFQPRRVFGHANIFHSIATPLHNGVRLEIRLLRTCIILPEWHGHIQLVYWRRNVERCGFANFVLEWDGHMQLFL